MEMKYQKQFNGLTVLNIELTSKCSKKCWMCGRRRIEKDHPELANWGDMKFKLVKKIAEQLPPNIMVQLHNNGEPLMYSKLREALQLFKNQIRQFDTNGRLLLEKRNDIIDNLEVLTISVIENDLEGDEQYDIVRQFLDFKGDRKPKVVYRLLGNVEKRERWEKLPGLVANRTIHNPMGSFKYRKSPTIPEHGICLDLLGHLVIDRYGMVSPCVRFDPKRLGVIGDINKTALVDIWNGLERKKWIRMHLKQQRDKIQLCSKCDFFGVATSA